jgi:valyl-tRNA synthetase
VSEVADRKFDLVFLTLKAARSLAASYTLQSDIQCQFVFIFQGVLF